MSPKFQSNNRNTSHQTYNTVGTFSDNNAGIVPKLDLKDPDLPRNQFKNANQFRTLPK